MKGRASFHKNEWKRSQQCLDVRWVSYIPRDMNNCILRKRRPHKEDLKRDFEAFSTEVGAMNLLYLLIGVVLLISQVMADPEGCKQERQTEWKDLVQKKGTFINAFFNSYEHRYCDSPTTVCLRRKTKCIRMPGLCPGRSFCCVRTTT
ncbi:uncharacterized protein LOC116071213 isoform X2 [Mastomys coucha]|uniref:uncharacterized protein LOC116071213 isoform X2 n=2 Tax=Mastomys coucha TaxID=35658 RepID=UPI001261C158|nr:uncharacterized protein LOC116071213 isoform X2 [Mastomys coucha]